MEDVVLLRIASKEHLSHRMHGIRKKQTAFLLHAPRFDTFVVCERVQHCNFLIISITSHYSKPGGSFFGPEPSTPKNDNTHSNLW